MIFGDFSISFLVLGLPLIQRSLVRLL